MKSYMNAVMHFVASEDGPTAVEYAVVVAFIIISCMAAIGMFGTSIRNWFNDASGIFAGLNTG